MAKAKKDQVIAHQEAVRKQAQMVRKFRHDTPHTGVYYGFSQFPELRKAYLRHLRAFGNRTSAACSVGMTLSQVNNWRDNNEDFRLEEEQAIESFKGEIEEAIKKRAIEGWDEPRFGQNGIQGTVRRYSDQLLLAYARRHIPEYRQGDATTTQATVTVDHKHSVEVKALTAEQRSALRLLLGTTDEDEPRPVSMPRITAEPANLEPTEPDEGDDDNQS